jgi:23S rRNA (guanosine2251-2'-O)-methyltransferase
MAAKKRQAKGKSRKKPLLASHQRSWLWGRNLVQETVAGGRWRIHELYLADDVAAEAAGCMTQAQAAGVKPTRATRTRLTQLCGAPDHQGYGARVGEYPYVPADVLRAEARAPVLWLILDGVQDPYNLGAMVRSAEVFGVDGVFLGAQGQAGIWESPASTAFPTSSACFGARRSG